MKATIGEAIGINGGSDEIDLLTRRIEALNNKMISLVNDTVASGLDMESNEAEFKEISDEIEQLNSRIQAIRDAQYGNQSAQERVALIQNTIEQRKANSDVYDDSAVRQMVECIVVHSDRRITVIFGGGYEVEEQVEG
jgi:chromosome segregation ATPase